MYARDPGHGWNSKSSQTEGGSYKVNANRLLMPSPVFIVSVGTVHGYEGPVHEKRPRFCFGVLHYSAVDI